MLTQKFPHFIGFLKGRYTMPGLLLQKEFWYTLLTVVFTFSFCVGVRSALRRFLQKKLLKKKQSTPID